MNEHVPYKSVELKDIDQAINDWFSKTVDAHVETPQSDRHKVPVIFSSGERWATGRTRQVFRDSNGVLILPIISVRRVAVDPNPEGMALGVQTNNIQIAVRVDPKTSQIKNLDAKPLDTNIQSLRIRDPNPVIYDVYTIPFPDRLEATYQLTIQAQYISQMNTILQKVWRSLDIQKSFVAPFENDGRQPPRLNQMGTTYEPSKPLPTRYVVGFMESTESDAGNLEEFTDQERIIKYTTEIRVPFVLLHTPEGAPSPVKVERTAYKLVMKPEVVTRADDPRVLDAIFGPSR